MAVPTVFSPVLKQDFTLNPITVHKRFVISSASYATTESGYRKWDAYYKGDALRIGDPNAANYATNSIDGTYKNIIWKSIDVQYYRFPYDRCATLEHANPRYTYKNLGISASILSIPQHDFGESIKPGSVEITASSDAFYLQDDGNGNIYISSLNTGSFPSRQNLVARFNFNELFRESNNLTYNSSTGRMETVLVSGVGNAQSNVMSNFPYSYKNLKFVESIDIGSRYCGFAPLFQPGYNSYIMTEHSPELNFENSNFSVCFWLNILQGTVDNQLLLNKSEVIRELSFNGFEYSSSLVDRTTNVYPYRVEYDAGSELLIFSRSDGIHTATIERSHSPEDVVHHYAFMKSGSILQLYEDGTLVNSVADTTDSPHNKNSLMFGSKNQIQEINDSSFGFFMDEIRFYDKELTAAEVTALSTKDQSLIQTAAVGNVFYKSGLIVISPYDYTYLNPFSGNPTIRWKSTHTIYEYEILCRVKKGSFNLSQNPSARQSPNSDLLLNDFTGSLMPYATSIGLYNDKGELMAVAKLGQAIQQRSDVDINYLIRIDV